VEDAKRIFRLPLRDREYRWDTIIRLKGSALKSGDGLIAIIEGSIISAVIATLTLQTKWKKGRLET